MVHNYSMERTRTVPVVYTSDTNFRSKVTVVPEVHIFADTATRDDPDLKSRKT